MTKERQHTGRTGEEIACDFLKEQGYSIVERNYRSRIGEIDIVAEHREYLVFCEVKTRRNRTGLHPSLSVTAKKIEKLRMLGEHYLSQKHLMHLQPRFDVIAVQLAGKTTPEIDHFVNAF
ncbi:MAG: YraN family protein [SAR324 cluster bacterium]|nr:YraN family protein [SAR324 cluster bacterium]